MGENLGVWSGLTFDSRKSTENQQKIKKIAGPTPIFILFMGICVSWIVEFYLLSSQSSRGHFGNGDFENISVLSGTPFDKKI